MNYEDCVSLHPMEEDPMSLDIPPSPPVFETPSKIQKKERKSLKNPSGASSRKTSHAEPPKKRIRQAEIASSEDSSSDTDSSEYPQRIHKRPGSPPKKRKYSSDSSPRAYDLIHSFIDFYREKVERNLHEMIGYAIQIDDNKSMIEEVLKTVRALTVALVNNTPHRDVRLRDEIHRAVQTLTAALVSKNQRPHRDVRLRNEVHRAVQALTTALESDGHNPAQGGQKSWGGQRNNTNFRRGVQGEKDKSRHFYSQRQQRKTGGENTRNSPVHPSISGPSGQGKRKFENGAGQQEERTKGKQRLQPYHNPYY